MDVTTFFLIFSVSALFNLTFDSNFGFYLTLLLILIALGFIGGAQNRLKGKVDGEECSGPYGAWHCDDEFWIYFVYFIWTI